MGGAKGTFVCRKASAGHTDKHLAIREACVLENHLET
jgi:hypothetical protein